MSDSSQDHRPSPSASIHRETHFPTAVSLIGSTALALSMLATPVSAQTTQGGKISSKGVADAAEQNAEDIVVTGTSIRGTQPVGSNLISVTRDDIDKTGAQTSQQILRTVPAVVGFGSAAQGGFGSADAAGTYAPTIHGLGASASNSTLILIDGHRLPLGGTDHALADPNIIPTIAIERVEVLPDGASSVYGSDAVAGVINFITRRRFNGVEATAQTSFGDGYRATNLAFLAGKTWDTGSILAAYSYSFRGDLSTGDRSRFTQADKRERGGTNFASFACAPATIQPTGSNLIYPSPYAAGVTNATANGLCDYTAYADMIPEDKRHSAIVKVVQSVGDRLTLSGDVVYSKRDNVSDVQRGSITATIFGPGSGRNAQINPFFQGVPGNAATSETIRFQADDLLGGGAKSYAGQEDFYARIGAEYRLSDAWRITVGGLYGFDNSYQRSVGLLCGSCATLALNGTTNAAGNLTTPSVPATGTIVTQPLTAANALDVFNTGSANRTSAAVRAALIDSTSTTLARQTIKDATIGINGTLFTLPAGPLKVALGGQITGYTLAQDVTRPNNTGPASTGSSAINLSYDRTVSSAYAEALIPIVSPEMDIPLVRSLELNLSGRYDHYSDFGSTTNPKLSANWEVVHGLKLRGNWARSFVAPALTSSGSNAQGVTAQSRFELYSGQINVPTSLYPQVIGLPGCAPGAATCAIGGTGVQGLRLAGGNARLEPQKGTTYSLGADFAPEFAPALRLGITYWYNRIRGGITAPSPALTINSPDLLNLLQIYPGGATPAQIAASTQGLPQTSVVPNVVYFIYNAQQSNALNLTVSGLDLEVDYRIETATLGTFTLHAVGSRKLRFDQQIGDGGTFSVLNTTGFNSGFPSIGFESRVGLGWSSANISANLFWNHTGSYRNWSGNTVRPLTRDALGLPTGGGDKVTANDTFDLNIAYTPSFAFLKRAQFFIDVQNLFDRDPPFYNIAEGYDSSAASPLGRIVTVGLRTTF